MNWLCLKQQLTNLEIVYDETGRADDKVSWCWSSQVLEDDIMVTPPRTRRSPASIKSVAPVGGNKRVF
jgi:hypothetical protein